MDTPTIRKTFLDFFAKRGHTVVPSSSLIPDDPTLLLTVAGMVQFKPYLMGLKKMPGSRAASVQKCFREKDLEEVGKTARHMTFFEMLGNFSFGDYFKSDAIKWAWELMTEGYGLDPDRLWATVFETDDDAAEIWQKEVGLPPEKVLRRTRADGNFWDMGVAGPCGPCSELLYDRGEAYGATYVPGAELDEERYLEIWNLVFMQNLQDDKGQILGDLPQQNVDTGMGLERLAAVLQDVSSTFEIDTMARILRGAEAVIGKPYDADAATDVSLRVLSEHSRAMTFLIADGVLPGNVGRGYVLRRLIRRAVRYARLAGVDGPVLRDLTDVVVAIYGNDYAEVGRNHDLVSRVVEKEEARFDTTLRQGLGLLEEEIARVRTAGGRKLSADVVFKLHDTYGFPFDLTADIVDDESLEVDRGEFESLMKSQRDRARAARGGIKEAEHSVVLTGVLEKSGKTSFEGYEQLTGEGIVVALVKDVGGVPSIEQGSEAEVVLDRTTFYSEGGGQIGDTGLIRTPSGTFEVSTTRWGIPGVAVHKGKVVSGAILLGETAVTQVDAAHREGVRQSHTATHLTHWVLRDFLGEHAKQQGSLVEPGRLRFDFSHFEPVAPERLAQMEEEINTRVTAGDPVTSSETSFDHAMSLGAMALFGEKYGDTVRLVEVGDYSKELCGGTHVAQTGQIGVIKFVHEGSVAAGVRRVEALTGMAGLGYLNGQAQKLQAIATLMKTPPDRLFERIEKTLSNLRTLESELNKQKHSVQGHEIDEMLTSSALQAVGGAQLLVLNRSADQVDELRKLAVTLRGRLGSGVVVLGSTSNGKANLVVAVSKDLIDKGVRSQDLISKGAGAIGGGGGGKPELAIAGGPNPDGLIAALEVIGRDARAALEKV